MGKIILTADDFGRSPAVNEAIARWHRAGALTHTSLMVNEPHAAEAVAMTREMPGLKIGLHLTLCDGFASDGMPLPRTPFRAGMRYAFSRGVGEWLRAEIAAQFEKFRSFGLPPGSWDGHTHLHLHPAVMALTVPIAKAHGFTFTRLVREPGPFGMLPAIFDRLSNHAEPALKTAGIQYADRVFGLRKTGRMDRAEFERAFAAASEGVTEIYFHPGAEFSLPEPEWVASKLGAC